VADQLKVQRSAGKETAVTEHESRDLVEVLSARFGNRHYSTIESGRADLVGAIADEMHVGRDEADTLLQRMIDSDRIRYVTGVERDIEHDVEAQDDEHSDRINRMQDEGLTDRSDNLRVNAIPGQGGPDAVSSGLTGAAVAPVAVAPGSSTPVGAPLAAGVPLGASAEDLQRGGYWDLSGAKGVRPSDSRKGQVEPEGI
jgi:hypothetical protein